MSIDADAMQSERDVRLAEIKKLEEAEAAAEEAARARVGKEGGKSVARARSCASRKRLWRKDLVRERD
ncbi:hypothetical protein FRC11_009814 [Ceratobasidium sp. 423]|nr:hypothetical protein FRC11_009814 [Ceratobasidium sp. 423]